MSIVKTLKDYQQGMAIYNACHQCNFATQWQAFQDEFNEFKAEPSWDEFWDVCHSFGKVVYQKTKLPLYLLAYPTVAKHSKRYSKTGCVRSKRNCEGKCCQN